MAAVLRMADFVGPFAPPTLVLVDLHLAFPRQGEEDPDRHELSRVLETCRGLLDFARQADMPVAFVRRMPLLSSFLAPHVYPPWIRGIEPRRSDMIFERDKPSCYASLEFAQMAQRSPHLVLAGLYGETACLSTLIEAHHRHHDITYLLDASCSRGHGEVLPEAMHAAVCKLASLYGRTMTAQDWMSAQSIKAAMAGT